MQCPGFGKCHPSCRWIDTVLCCQEALESAGREYINVMLGHPGAHTPTFPPAVSMVKSKEEVIAEFNLQNNMTVEELQAWLDNPKSKEAGTGVGLESGHKIIGILKKNPSKDPELYDDVSGSRFLRIHATR